MFSSETVFGVSVPSAAFEEPGAIISENPNIHDTKPIDNFLVPYFGVFSSLNALFFSMTSAIFFEFFITFLSSYTLIKYCYKFSNIQQDSAYIKILYFLFS